MKKLNFGKLDLTMACLAGINFGDYVNHYNVGNKIWILDLIATILFVVFLSVKIVKQLNGYKT